MSHRPLPVQRKPLPTQRKLPPPPLPQRSNTSSSGPLSTSSLECTRDNPPTRSASHAESLSTASPCESTPSLAVELFDPVNESQTIVAEPTELFAPTSEVEKDSISVSERVTPGMAGLQISTTHDVNKACLEAIDAGDLDEVQRAIQRGADLRFELGRPLRLASHLGHHEIVKYLLEQGAFVNACNETKETSLHTAATQGNVKVARTLIEHGANVDAQDANCRTPLHSAVWASQVSIAIVKLLLEKGADLSIATKQNKNTPLHGVAFDGREQLGLMLLDEGADPSAKNTQGETPLYIAARSGNTPIAQLLLDHGENKHRITIINATNEIGWTALHVAAHNSHEGIVQILLDCGASINTKSAPHKDYAGLGRQTALHLAVGAGSEPIVRLLVERGADVMSKNSDGKTALDEAKSSFSRNDAIAKLLPQESRTPAGKRAWSILGAATTDTFRVARQGLGKFIADA